MRRHVLAKKKTMTKINTKLFQFHSFCQEWLGLKCQRLEWKYIRRIQHDQIPIGGWWTSRWTSHIHERGKWYENSCTKLHKRLILNLIKPVGRDLYFICTSLFLIESQVSTQIVEGLMPTIFRFRTLFHNIYRYILQWTQKIFGNFSQNYDNFCCP